MNSSVYEGDGQGSGAAGSCIEQLRVVVRGSAPEVIGSSIAGVENQSTLSVTAEWR
jgi:hypothetical protein